MSHSGLAGLTGNLSSAPPVAAAWATDARKILVDDLARRYPNCIINWRSPSKSCAVRRRWSRRTAAVWRDFAESSAQHQNS